MDIDMVKSVCSTKWPSEMRIGPKVALRNAGGLRSLTADKDYDDISFREIPLSGQIMIEKRFAS